MTIQVNSLTAFCTAALIRAGLTARDSQLAAEALVLTDTWGVHTHGVKNLRGYIRRIRGGGIAARGEPKIISEGPAWAMVDGCASLGMVASAFAMETAVQKARTAGFAYVGLRNSCHFGAAGVYSVMAAMENMIGVAMSNDTPTVTVPGSRGAVLGSNPLSYAIPVRQGPPLFLDIATSAVAGGKVFQAAARGEKIPTGWIVDGAGEPSTDPTIFPNNASLTPMAGHKGYGIAFLIETLSAILTGASIAQHVLSWSFADPSLPTNHGAAFLAVNISAMQDMDLFQDRLAQTISEIRSAPRKAGVNKIYVPGEIEWEKRHQALTLGLSLPPETSAQLRALGEEIELDFGNYHHSETES